MTGVFAAWDHIKARLKEKSTYAGFVGAIGAGAALAYPFNWVGVLIGLVAVLLPSS